MESSLAQRWRESFFEVVRTREAAGVLKEAAVTEQLADWTTALTSAVVDACGKLGWIASAKAHRLEMLPVRRSEYLGLDIVAFPGAAKRWRFPAGIVELENQADDRFIEYSLWKLMCVRADLRILFCYRRNRRDAAALIRHLRDEVVGAMDLSGRLRLEGHTVVVVGCWDEAATFPYGFFKWWCLDTNTGLFEQVM